MIDSVLAPRALFDAEALLAHVIAETWHMTGWALIVGVTVLGSLMIARTAAQGGAVPASARMTSPRYVTIGHERHWVPRRIAGIAGSVLLANAVVYLVAVWPR